MDANYLTPATVLPAELAPYKAELLVAARYFAEARKTSGAAADELRDKAERKLQHIEAAIIERREGQR